MTDFTFLHAADLHLGSPFTGLALKHEETARRFASAGREAFRAVIDAAIQARVGFAVIAGDIYDGEWNDASIGLFFNREIARLHRAGIPVFSIRGNHDAVSEVTRSLPLPASVREFGHAAAETLRVEHLRVALHGRSYAIRDVTDNLALGYPAAVAGWFNIGVLHTALSGRAGHQSYAPCTEDDLKTRGYDYWALGHVHGYEEVCRDPWIVYPGNLQGRSIRECGAKGAVLVDVSEGRVKAVRRVIADRARWAIADVPLDGIADESLALDAVRNAITSHAQVAEDRLLALRVRLTGRSPLHRRLVMERTRLAEDIQAIADHVSSDLWVEKLEVATADVTASRAVEGALADLDLAAALEEAAKDEDFRRSLGGLMALVKTKLPASVDEAGLFDVEALLSEARATVLGRVTQLSSG